MGEGYVALMRGINVGGKNRLPMKELRALFEEWGDPSRSDIDRFRVLGREVHLHVPGGMARTKLTTDYFDRRLAPAMTVRNWRTVQKLIEMTT